MYFVPSAVFISVTVLPTGIVTVFWPFVSEPPAIPIVRRGRRQRRRAGRTAAPPSPGMSCRPRPSRTCRSRRSRRSSERGLRRLRRGRRRGRRRSGRRGRGRGRRPGRRAVGRLPGRGHLLPERILAHEEAEGDELGGRRGGGRVGRRPACRPRRRVGVASRALAREGRRRERARRRCHDGGGRPGRWTAGAVSVRGGFSCLSVPGSSTTRTARAAPRRRPR